MLGAGRATERRAARAGARARDLPRDHLRVAQPRAAPARRVPRPEATFTHLAAREQFGAAAEYVPAPTIADVFRDVERGRADFGVVPVENSTEGMVAHTLDLLVESPLAHLRRGRAARPALPARAAGHRRSRRPPRRRASAGAGAVPALARGASAGVPTERRGEQRARRRARRRPSAARRRSPPRRRRPPTASHVLAARHPGRDRQRDALPRARPRSDAEQPTRRRQDVDRAAPSRTRSACWPRCCSRSPRIGIDLIKIESRPLRGRPWEYVFFLDLRGHRRDARVKRALAAVRAARAPR